MAIPSLQSGTAPANTIVQAYLAARARDQQLDQSDGPNNSFEARTAQFTEAGARDYATKWSIEGAEHGALVALLAANRLQFLIDGYSVRNNRDQKVVTFGIEELHEVHQIKRALMSLWRHLDSGPCLKALAIDLDLIDETGGEIG